LSDKEEMTKRLEVKRHTERFSTTTNNQIDLSVMGCQNSIRSYIDKVHMCIIKKLKLNCVRMFVKQRIL
jgi:hypothetical protein